jgi:hypothetical protein
LTRSDRLRGPVMFAVYAGAALLIHNPLILIGIAILAGVALPRLFPSISDDDDES